MQATRLTELFNLQMPIMSAGMAGIAGPELVAAVSNAGGIGTLGAVGMTPSALKQAIQRTRGMLEPGRPMGVDLLLPKVGDGARKTNRDYTDGQLEQLIKVLIDEKVELFVSAVGVPPRTVVERLQENGCAVMNMVGSTRHVRHCIAAGVDIICAQGSEAGGHTGSVSTMVLVPQIVDLCRNTGIIVVAAGGIVDGRGVAASLALGADGVWVGSRFIMTEEANAAPAYKRAIRDASSEDTIKTEVYTGRPVRMISNAYAREWETTRKSEQRDLLSKGIVPFHHDAATGRFGDNIPDPIPRRTEDVREMPDELFDSEVTAMLVGQGCGQLKGLNSATEVITEMHSECNRTITRLNTL